MTVLTFVYERLLAALAETLHDSAGLCFPPTIAPFSCVVSPIRYEGESKGVADQISAELNAAGLDVLIDDRDLRPGAKFAEADLIGVPVRITIGERGLKEGKVEVKRRGGSATMVPVTEAAAAARAS